MNMQQIVIDNRICNVHAKGKKAPVFIYVNAPSIPVGAKQIAEAFEKINNKDVVFYRCGTRKTKASGATQYMIDKFNLSKIIVIGTCAGVDESFELIDVFIPNKAVQADCTYLENGDLFKEDFIVDIDLSELDFNYNTCTIGSSDKPMIHKQVCDLMYKNNLTIVDMESAPIAYICKINNVECIIIKGISDFPGKYDVFDENQFKEYVVNIPKVINKILINYLDRII